MGTLQFKRPKVTWRRLLIGALGVGAVAGAVWLGRSVSGGQAEAAQVPPAPETPAASPVPPPSVAADSADYSHRVVAYVFGNTIVTREQLGEYLIARLGPDKVLNLVNRLIIERTCRDRGIIVTDTEVDLALAEDIASLRINRREFIDKLLREYHKSLYEWKEDVLRPKLLMTKMLQNQVRVEEDDVRKAYESYYGEKVQCQAIIWPREKAEEALKLYPAIRDSAEEFERQAKLQSSGLAGTFGMMEPFGRYGFGDDAIEQEVFKLKEGEITKLLRSPSTAKDTDPYTVVVMKLMQRLPANATKKMEDVRPALEKEIIDSKVRAAIFQEMPVLQKAAAPKICLKPILPDDDWDRKMDRVEAPASDGVPPAQQPVAFIYGTTAVTREQLGEYLIKRYGAERLELMVNKMIVDRACAERGLTVTEAEIEAALAEDIEAAKAGTKKKFIEEYLHVNQTNLYGYREDLLRPKLLLTKLARAQVKVEAEDLRKAAEAYHGEKAECQIIMWPRTPQEHEIAIKQYELFRKKPEEFDRAARMQSSPRLAAAAGRIPAFSRYSTGNDDLEREVFALRAGELTPVIETPQGYVVARLIRKTPADRPTDDPAKAAAERAEWEKEILRKKAQMQIPAEFAKLRNAAAPNILLQPMLREEDWIRDVKKEIGAPQPERVKGGVGQ